jgi:hypothetical protein
MHKIEPPKSLVGDSFEDRFFKKLAQDLACMNEIETAGLEDLDQTTMKVRHGLFSSNSSIEVPH